MASESPSAHGFDYWATLARRDPESFEAERACVIETAIRQASPQNQPRLRCLQWKLDQIRRLSSTPMAASLLMNRMLWQAVAGRHGLVERLNYLQTPGGNEYATCKSAEILPFPD